MKCPYSHKYQLVRWAYDHISSKGNPRKSLIKLLPPKYLYHLWYNHNESNKDASRDKLYSMIKQIRRKRNE